MKRLTATEIEELAGDLHEGDETNVHHCKTGWGNDRLYIKRVSNGWVYHCFHCGVGGLARTSVRSSSARRTPTKIKSFALPSDVTSNWNEFSLQAKAWLNKYITRKEVEDNHILYSQGNDRVILPIYKDGELMGFQTRRLNPEDNRPKYLTYTNNKEHFYYHNNTGDNVLVLCEDMLSAIKCSRVASSVALFGVNLKDALLAEIAGNYSKYLVFLDDDTPQVKIAQLRLKTRLDNFGECAILSGIGKDPKELTDEELKEIIK